MSYNKREVEIVKYKTLKNKPYLVRVFRMYEPGIKFIEKSKRFKTKSQALRFAKKWMKKHPNG